MIFSIGEWSVIEYQRQEKGECQCLCPRPKPSSLAQAWVGCYCWRGAAPRPTLKSA